MTTTIDLQVNGRTNAYDRDRLTTAMLVYLDMVGPVTTPTFSQNRAVALALRNHHGFDRDGITYALAAGVAIASDVEP